MDAKLMGRVLPAIGLLAEAADHSRLSEWEPRQFNEQIDAALTENTGDPEFLLLCKELVKATDILSPAVSERLRKYINSQSNS